MAMIRCLHIHQQWDNYKAMESGSNHLYISNKRFSNSNPYIFSFRSLKMHNIMQSVHVLTNRNAPTWRPQKFSTNKDRVKSYALLNLILVSWLLLCLITHQKHSVKLTLISQLHKGTTKKYEDTDRKALITRTSNEDTMSLTNLSAFSHQYMSNIKESQALWHINRKQPKTPQMEAVEWQQKDQRIPKR